jgi:hypothetical protein
MKKKIFISGLIISLVVVSALFFKGCMDVQSKAMPAADPAAVEEKKTQPPSPQKWREMMAADIDTLQIGDTKVEKGRVYVVSFHHRYAADRRYKS